MTPYTILKKKGDDWSVIGERSAASSRAAISAVLDGKSEGGIYVAIPSRSFKPVPVKFETKATFG